MALTTLTLSLLLFIFSCGNRLSDASPELNTKPFPDDFSFGLATSAYQVEGAWNEDGKGESLWDHYTHARPDMIKDHSTGDIACDSYHKIDEDVAMLKTLGANHYRLSLAWTRILPNGTIDYINQAGVQYYKKLIKALKAANIEPLVTIFHWDTPMAFENHGGFVNASIIDRFVDYAKLCFELFGDDVKWWITFNEPKQTCNGGYGYAYFPPYIRKDGLLDYICAHNVLKAHAKVYHLYDKEFRPKQKGKISVVIDTPYFLPSTHTAEDKAATERIWAFEFGWFADPVYLGDYPEIMKTRVAARSKAEGYKESRLPTFTKEEIEYINGTHDFFGVNHYTTFWVDAVPEPAVQHLSPSRYGDMACTQNVNPKHEIQANGWNVFPHGIRHLMKYIKNKYNNPPIIITENGYTDYGGLYDFDRISFLNRYLSNVRDAMEHDGANVIGYSFWSVMDNYEWTSGYTIKYGLHQVDFNDKNRTRTIKESGKRYQEITKNRHL